MALYSDPIEVFNAALVVCGEDPISANDDSAEAVLFRSNYEMVVCGALARHKWSFARKTKVLEWQGLSGNTPTEVYPLPGDYILAHKVTFSSDKTPLFYELRGDKLLMDSNDDEFYLHYTYRAEENLWSADFTNVVVMFLKGIIRRSQDDAVEADRIEKKAEEKLIEALGRDRNAQSKNQHTPDPRLVRAHRGAGRV